jgi:hypothetical protein
MTGAFDPDLPMVRVDNATRDGKSQAGSTTFEFGFSGGMQIHFAGLKEFFEDKLLMARVNPDACILDPDLYPRSSVGIFDGLPGDGNPPTIRRVFDGVANHLIENLVQQVFICVNSGQAR